MSSAVLDMDECKLFCRTQHGSPGNFKYEERSERPHDSEICNEYRYNRSHDNTITVWHETAPAVSLAVCGIDLGQRIAYESYNSKANVTFPQLKIKESETGMQLNKYYTRLNF